MGPATVTRHTTYNHVAAEQPYPDLGTPALAFTVMGKGVTRKQVPYYKLSGKGMLMNSANGVFGRAGVLWHKGEFVDTQAMGFMTMAYWPSKVAKEVFEGLVNGEYEPDETQVHFWKVDLDDRNKVPYPVEFDGEESLIVDHQIDGNYVFAIVKRGEHWIKTADRVSLTDEDFVYKAKKGDIKVRAADRFRARLDAAPKPAPTTQPEEEPIRGASDGDTSFVDMQ